jgi:L-malate glycosyltransferase
MDTARANVHRLLRVSPSNSNPSGAGVRLALCAPGELWGGVEQFVDTLSRHLMAAGIPVLVIALFDGPLRVRLERSGVPVTVIGGSRRYDPRAITRIVKVLRQHRINVVHTHGYKATILGATAARLTGARLVRTEHGRLEPAAGIQWLKMGLNQHLETLASRYGADAVVFVSDDVRRHSPSTRSATVQVQEVIHNGIEAFGSPAITESLEGFQSGAELFKVGIIGRLVPVKGHTHLLQAVKALRHLPDLRLYVFGEGPLEEEHRRYCEVAGLSDIVRFMGFKDNVRDYLSQLDLLAIPSLHEGLPYTLLEAMYCRVPVIASNVGGLAEVIEDHVTGILVPPADHHALALSIERLHHEPAVRKALAEAAFRKASDQFLVGRMAARYLDVYRTVLAPTRFQG